MSVNQKKLRKRLEWLWQQRVQHEAGDALSGSERWRYVPRAYSSSGPGWGVYDRLGDRFLSDSEVAEMPMERLQTATHLS